MKIFAENFNYYIKQTGETQRDLAKRINVCASTICDWRKCRAYPRMDKIEKLAKHWGITMSDLVEKRSLDSTYYLEKEAKSIAEEFVDDPAAYSIYQSIKKLSPANKVIVLSLINSLNGGES